MCPTDPVGLEIYVPGAEAVARRMPTAALVAVLAERGDGGEVTDSELVEAEKLAATLTPGHFTVRLVRAYVILRALAAHELPCGHKLENIIYGGPDLNGLPAVAQCGQCLADRQAAKAALPRTPETVLRAMLRAYEAAAMDAYEKAFGMPKDSAEKTMVESRADAIGEQLTILCREIGALRAGWPVADMEFNRHIGLTCEDAETLRADYEARLAGTRPLDAPPMETP